MAYNAVPFFANFLTAAASRRTIALRAIVTMNFYHKHSSTLNLNYCFLQYLGRFDDINLVVLMAQQFTAAKINTRHCSFFWILQQQQLINTLQFLLDNRFNFLPIIFDGSPKLCTGEAILCFFNSSPAIIPLAASYFGVIFLRGHISLKNGTYCPLFTTIHPFSKARVFLSSYKKRRLLCMGRTSTANPCNN
jgi:hypothetical protein